MQCPYCNDPETRVIDSRLAAGGSATRRRRECACGKRFTTYERVEHQLPAIVKKDGARQPFDRQKLLRSMEIACNKRPVSRDQLEEHAEAIERDLEAAGEKEVPSRVLGGRVMRLLEKLDEVAYVRFASVYKSFRDIDEFMREMGELVRSRGAAGTAAEPAAIESSLPDRSESDSR